MPAVVLRVKGLSRLSRSLREAGSDLEELRGVFAEVSDIVEIEAKRRAPRLTGRLARTVRPGESARRASVRAGRGSSVPYAGPIHWGWPARNIDENTFIVDAAQATEPRWLGVFQRELERITSRVEGA